MTAHISVFNAVGVTMKMSTKTVSKRGRVSSMLVLASFSIAAALAASPRPVALGSAGEYVILAKSGISSTGTTAITGNIGVYPIAATGITGFGLILNHNGQYSTSRLVEGKVYAANYAAPTPANLIRAVGDMETAYRTAAGEAPNVTELGNGNIGGMTLKADVYKWSSAVNISSDLTLSGSSTDVWILQIAKTLTLSNGVQIKLAGGAQAKNVFWQVAGVTALGTTSVMNGTVLDATAITLNTGATLNGNALAQTDVTLIDDTIK